MKNLNYICTFVFLLIFSVSALAQQKDTFFAGKWDATVKGLPQGDAKVLIKFEEKDSKWSGNITVINENKEMAFTAIELKDSVVTVKFDYNGDEVTMVLNKKDDQNITGSVNNHFDVTGVRKKEDQP